MKTISYKIYGLDCIEEVRIIKEALNNIIDPEHMHFDLLNGKLVLTNFPESLQPLQIEKALSKTGMKAVEWDLFLEENKEPLSFFQQYSRVIVTFTALICLIIGFTIHVYSHSFFDAVSGGVNNLAKPHRYPYLSLGFYLLSIISGGWFIFPKAFIALKRWSADMNLLMSIAVIGAMIIHQWFEAATVTTLFSIALLLESWSIGRARKAIKGLLALTPDEALRYCNNDLQFELKPLAEIPIGSRILVKPGGKIPLDGAIIEGRAFVNEAPITGESMAVSKTVGDTVYAGSINGDTSFEFTTTRAADDTTLAHIVQMIELAQSRRANTEKWVERFAKIYTPSMILLACLIALIPPLLFGESWSNWFYEALVILVIACPCALVISTPVSIVAGLSSAAKNGILIKGGNFLEKPASIEAIAFDKTGTITEGKPSIQEIIPLDNHDEEQLLSIAASLEQHSDHPLAQAIVNKAQQLGIATQAIKDFQLHQGKGVEGHIDGQLYWIGSHRWLHEKCPQQENDDFHQKALQLEDKGHSLVIIGSTTHLCGLISIADSIKPEMRKTLKQLKAVGIKNITMLTGDNQGTARAIAQFLHLDNYKAELLPEDKVAEIEQLNQIHQRVAMVGDGINDAPAMATASLGIAMGAIGSDAAIETADIALMSDDIQQLPKLILHSRRVLTIIKQNISFALATKAVFIGLALYEIASLWMAIAADMGASLIVIFNGLRLLSMKEEPSLDAIDDNASE